MKRRAFCVVLVALARLFAITGNAQGWEEITPPGMTMIATLVNGQKEPGTYHLEFHAGGLPSGVYLYRLQAGGYAASRLMVLIR